MTFLCYNVICIYIGAVSATDQQQFPAFRRNEDSLSEQQPRDHTPASHPSDSRSVRETTTPAHQPAVGQTHSNYLTVCADLTTKPQAHKGFDTTESVMKVEPLQDTTQAPQMDSPLADKTLPMNQTSVYETSLNSDSSVNETTNHLPENETSTINLPMDTAPLSSHLLLHKPPPSHHLLESETSPSNQPPIDGTLPSKHPPVGETSFSSHPPIVDRTSPSNHVHLSVDKTLPSQHPLMTYIPPLSSHSPADEYQQPTNSEPADGKPCDRHAQHKTPSISKEVRFMKQTALMAPDSLL